MLRAAPEYPWCGETAGICLRNPSAPHRAQLDGLERHRELIAHRDQLNRRLEEPGPAFSPEAILDALDAAKTEDTVIAHEWTSVDTAWDRLDLSRPGSLYFPASGAIGSGVPAAIGLQLRDPSRRVLAIIGDGALHYTVNALRTAAHYRVPVVFVVARNHDGALKSFARLLNATDAPGLDLPDIDVLGIATAYGIPAVPCGSDRPGPRGVVRRRAPADRGPAAAPVRSR